MEWTRAHDIAVKVTGIDPRTQRSPVSEWAPYQSNKWLCALEAAKMALAGIPEMPRIDLNVGVVTSDDGHGSETKVSVKQWSVGVEGPPRITFGIHIGDGRWVETSVAPEDALKVVTLIFDKPAVKDVLEKSNA